MNRIENETFDMERALSTGLRTGKALLRRAGIYRRCAVFLISGIRSGMIIT